MTTPEIPPLNHGDHTADSAWSLVTGLLTENNQLRDQITQLQSELSSTRWLKWSQIVDSWRIIPRLLMLFYMWLLWWSVMWFTEPHNFPPGGPTSEQTTLISVLVGSGAAWFGAYVATGDRRTS